MGREMGGEGATEEDGHWGEGTAESAPGHFPSRGCSQSSALGLASNVDGAAGSILAQRAPYRTSLAPSIH